MCESTAPLGSKGGVPGEEVRGCFAPNQAEALWVFGRSMEATNLPSFLIFGNARKSHILLSLQNVTSGHELNWGVGAKVGACPPGLGLKPLMMSVPICNYFHARRANNGK